MISGAHAIIYSTNAEADRKFFGDVLKFPHVDAGDGWLIFALPPSEVAVHPAKKASHEVYLMCDDLKGTIEELKGKGVKCSTPSKQEWGTIVRVKLPSGGELGLYHPEHPVAHRYARPQKPY